MSLKFTEAAKAGYHGRGSQLNPNQCFVKNKTAGGKGSPVIGSICFRWAFPFLCTMAFMLTHALADEQTGICKLKNPTFIWDTNSVVNSDTIGLCPFSSTQQLPTQYMNVCIPQGHLNAENRSPDPLGPPILSRANVKMVMTVLAIIGGIGLVGWVLYKHQPRAFTEADINRGLAEEPAVPRRSNPTFEIPPSIH